MNTTLLSVLAFGACASVALAEPLLPAAGAQDSATVDPHPAGPVALTEAEMDKVSAGRVNKVDSFYIEQTTIKDREIDVMSWSWGATIK